MTANELDILVDRAKSALQDLLNSAIQPRMREHVKRAQTHLIESVLSRSGGGWDADQLSNFLLENSRRQKPCQIPNGEPLVAVPQKVAEALLVIDDLLKKDMNPTARENARRGRAHIEEVSDNFAGGGIDAEAVSKYRSIMWRHE